MKVSNSLNCTGVKIVTKGLHEILFSVKRDGNIAEAVEQDVMQHKVHISK